MSEPDHDPSTDELIERARSGDVEALGALLPRFERELRHQIRLDRRYQRSIDVDDILHNTFLEVCRSIATFVGPPGAFRHWLKAIAERRAIDAVRHQRRQRRPPPSARMTPPPGEDPIRWLARVVMTSSTPSHNVASEELKEKLRGEINRLPDVCRRVIWDTVLNDRSDRDCGVSMGRTKGAVRAIRARAINLLRERMRVASEFWSG